MIGTSLAVGALLFDCVGGVYFGLASCGGYAWHKTAFSWTLTGMAVLTLVMPSGILRTWRRRFCWPVILVLSFTVIQAVAATFYPAAPESPSDFFRVFKQTLIYGPC